MTTVYIAAPYPTRDNAIRIMTLLEGYGFQVTSRWLKAHDTLSDSDARKDLDDIARADVLLALNGLDWVNQGSGGRHVEFGYALALGIPIVMLGPRSNIFHHLTHVMIVEDETAMIGRLQFAGALAALRQQPQITSATAVRAVMAEFRRASARHPPMVSPHEGYAVILEELDELWDEIKHNRGRAQEALEEAIQIAAMGLRYVTDLAEGTP